MNSTRKVHWEAYRYGTSEYYSTACWLWGRRVEATLDRDKVTCKTCLRILRAREAKEQK